MPRTGWSWQYKWLLWVWSGQTEVNLNMSQLRLYFCAYVKTSRGASAVQSDRVQLFVEVLLHLSALFFFNKAGLFNTPPVVIPPCAHSEWKRWHYFLLWAISPGLSLYSCVLVYKALRYNTEVIMGHFLTGTWITEIQPNRWFFLGGGNFHHTLSVLFTGGANIVKLPDIRFYFEPGHTNKSSSFAKRYVK